MTQPIYIQGIGTITSQPELLGGNEEVRAYQQACVPAVDPDYKALIPALQLRRLNKSMRMALYAARVAMRGADVEQVDAVVTGTGLGCLTDSERFVQAMLENDEQFLNPTPFIQSTHNMAAATIALAIGCKGYNMTYVHNATSMEAAMLDTMLYLSEHPDSTVLLGGGDELGLRTPQFWEHAGYLDTEQPQLPTPLTSPGTPGEVASEGAAFFAVSAKKSERTVAKIMGVKTAHDVIDLSAWIGHFLVAHGVGMGDLDLVMLGYNGDSRYDPIYRSLSDGVFADVPQATYKHVLGEFDTVVAPGMALAAQILVHQRVPTVLRLNALEPARLRRILLYNQRRGKNHSLILMATAEG